MATRYKYDSAIETAYARANRASKKANDARGRAMGSPRNPSGHRRAAALFRVAGRLYMKAYKLDKGYGQEAAKSSFATAIFHDRYAKKIAHGEMGAPGSHWEMQRLVRGKRSRRGSSAVRDRSRRHSRRRR